MAGLVLGGLLGAKKLFSYNRNNFFFDRKLRQERDFQEQDMRVEQFSLYREDVRDLVELTVGKMDLYLVAAALLVDRTTVMLCKQSRAFPRWSPDWAVTLNSLSLASGIFYLLLALWLAMYASISAQSFGARLLTQFVRLPYASEEQMDQATASGVDYEGRDVGDMLRVPILQRSSTATAPGRDPADGVADTAASSSSAAASCSHQPLTSTLGPSTPPSFDVGTSAADAQDAAEGQEAGQEPGMPQDSSQPWDLLPSAMLDHIRLYRRVQLNWQAYDAYARVSLFAGTSSLLYSCLYWSLGQFLQVARAPMPALGVALVFSTVQIVLSRLDLRLPSRDTFKIGCLLATTPWITTIGMLLYRSMWQDGTTPPFWKVSLMSACAIAAHTLHAVVVALMLYASWPDPRSDEEALLPRKFRSTLYLDVFGWLLNPMSPDAATTEDPEVAAGATSDSNPTADVGVSSSPADVAPCGVSSRTGETGVSGRDPSLDVESRNLDLLSAVQRAQSDRLLTERGPQLRSFMSVSETSSGPLGAVSLAGSGGGATGISDALEEAQGRGQEREDGAGGGATRRRMQTRRVDFSPDVRREAMRIFDPQAQTRSFDDPRDPRRRASVPASFQSPSFQASSSSSSFQLAGSRPPPTLRDERWGGREAVDLATMDRATQPNTSAPSTFTPMPPQRVSRKSKSPGETPWLAFKQGTIVILALWVLSTVWTCFNLFLFGWKESNAFKPDLTPPDLAALNHFQQHAKEARQVALITRAACSVGSRSTFDRHRLLLSATSGRYTNDSKLPFLRSSGLCNLKQPLLATFSTCNEDAPAFSREPCAVALLHRGGRMLTICHVWQRSNSSAISPWMSLRVADRSLALVQFAVELPRRPGSSKDLRIFGRTANGALLVFRASGYVGLDSTRARHLLVPELELEEGVPREGRSASVRTPLARQVLQERFLVRSSLLLALQARGFKPSVWGRCSNTAALGHSTAELTLRVWDFKTGQSARFTVSDLPRSTARDEGRALAAICTRSRGLAPSAANASTAALPQLTDFLGQVPASL